MRRSTLSASLIPAKESPSSSKLARRAFFVLNSRKRQLPKVWLFGKRREEASQFLTGHGGTPSSWQLKPRMVCERSDIEFKKAVLLRGERSAEDRRRLRPR